MMVHFGVNFEIANNRANKLIVRAIPAVEKSLVRARGQ
jgi:hypothetical protein